MDDLNKKRSNKPARQQGVAPIGTQAALPAKDGGAAPDGAAPGSMEPLAASVAEAVKSVNGADAHASSPLGSSSGGGMPGRAQAANAPEIVHAPPSRKRVKAVRASYAVPKADLATLAALKEACRGQGVKAKKNQLLRVAIGLLREVEPARLAELVAALPPAGRKGK